MFHIKRVYINYLFTTMQKEFLTGLKLRNSLSNQLVKSLSIIVNFRSHGRKKCQMVHLWTNCLLKQPYGTRKVFLLFKLETISATIWSVEFSKTTLDTTFNIVWTLLMLMTKLSTNQMKKEFSILSLLEDGRLTSLTIWSNYLL